MDALINQHDNQMPPLRLEALALAGELPLQVLLKLCPLYRAAGNDTAPDAHPDEHTLGDTWLRSIDAALWRLETDAR